MSQRHCLGPWGHGVPWGRRWGALGGHGGHEAGIGGAAGLFKLIILVTHPMGWGIAGYPMAWGEATMLSTEIPPGIPLTWSWRARLTVPWHYHSRLIQAKFWCPGGLD